MNFEILPAGTLGPRQELSETIDDIEGSQMGTSQTQAKPKSLRRARLRKKPPAPQLRQEDVT